MSENCEFQVMEKKVLMIQELDWTCRAGLNILSLKHKNWLKTVLCIIVKLVCYVISSKAGELLGTGVEVQCLFRLSF